LRESSIAPAAEQAAGLHLVLSNLNFMLQITQSGVASQLREDLSFSFWDSQIIACALTSGCGILVSEDMQDGQIIDGMAIKNIFKSA
jgi:predicted nucleic acid-binding protein